MGSLRETAFWKWGSLGESKMWKIKRGSFSDRRFENGGQCGRTYLSRIFWEWPPGEDATFDVVRLQKPSLVSSLVGVWNWMSVSPFSQLRKGYRANTVGLPSKKDLSRHKWSLMTFSERRKKFCRKWSCVSFLWTQARKCVQITMPKWVVSEFLLDDHLNQTNKQTTLSARMSSADDSAEI